MRGITFVSRNKKIVKAVVAGAVGITLGVVLKGLVGRKAIEFLEDRADEDVGNETLIIED